jgi:hypothetical protein
MGSRHKWSVVSSGPVLNTGAGLGPRITGDWRSENLADLWEVDFDYTDTIESALKPLLLWLMQFSERLGFGKCV